MPVALQEAIVAGLREDKSNRRNYHYAKTSSYTVKQQYDTGATLTNLGATAAVTLTLPQGAIKGNTYTFAVQAEVPLIVDPGAAGAIYWNGAKQTDDVALVSQNIGDHITLECDGNHDWVVTNVRGSWGLDDDAFRWTLKENFVKSPALNADILITSGAPTLAQMAKLFNANPNWEVIGTNSTTALCALSTRGGITLTTAGAGSDVTGIAAHSDTGASGILTADFATDDRLRFRAQIYTGADITPDCIIIAGFKLTPNAGAATIAALATATDNDQTFFRYENGVGSGMWQCIDSATGTDTTSSSGVTVAASTRYDLQIIVSAARVPRYYINGVHVATGNALTTAVDLVPVIAVGETQGGAGAARAITVVNVEISKLSNS